MTLRWAGNQLENKELMRINKKGGEMKPESPDWLKIESALKAMMPILLITTQNPVVYDVQIAIIHKIQLCVTCRLTSYTKSSCV